ncbi:response regulator transcription factor [Sporomusa sp.]|uniref:response regulator transcription factor n=1 Tax=Sporomusa sp. TaxID=2078658 RepID=UPI002B5BC7D0|nr:response regulator transcription factor [Sporomusa sp.]HWR44224.1 response regulator transcription factor [Sporomusa sp.]
MTGKIKIFLADDHALVRTGIRMLLKSDPRLEVIGEADNGQEVLNKLVNLKVDILVLDISMPQMSGLDCIGRIRDCHPEIRILMLSMHEDKNYIINAMKLGAAGYVPKASADTELFDAIHEVAKGNIYLSRNAAQSLVSELFSANLQQGKKADEGNLLSGRELEVLKYIVHGHSITEVGEMLNLSVKTIDTYKTRIMEKLNCKKKSQLVEYALKNGLLNPL